MCSNIMSYRTCPKGNNCNFAHSPMELRGGGGGGGGGMMGGPMGGGPGPAAAGANQPTKYKTVMCNHMSTTGTCSRGSSCNFAHSQVGGICGRSMRWGSKLLSPRFFSVFFLQSVWG